MKSRLLLFTPLLLASFVPALLAAPKSVPFTFAAINVPGAVATEVWGSNNHGDLVGAYGDRFGLFHGFVYKNGQFTTVDGPGAAFTQIRSIDDEGDIVGTFITFTDVFAHTPGGGFQGLYQKNGGPLTVYNVPGHLNTIFTRIKTGNVVFGCFHDDGSLDSPQASMFGIVVRMDEWPKIQTFQYGSSMHGGGDTGASTFTGPMYDFSVSRHRGYLLVNKGTRDNPRMTQTTFDVPGSNLTSPWDMDNAGNIVGLWGNDVGNPDPQITTTGRYHGFLRDTKGNFTTIDFPGSVDTQPKGTNNYGDIVGSYIDATGMHGFVAHAGNSPAVAKAMPVSRNQPVLASLYPSAGLAGSTASYAAPKFQVASMRVIPKNTPLAKAASSAPSCHALPMKLK